ncbi:MAG TPA: hypothetical protein VIS27_10290 [Yeosuana sp.]
MVYNDTHSFFGSTNNKGEIVLIKTISIFRSLFAILTLVCFGCSNTSESPTVNDCKIYVVYVSSDCNCNNSICNSDYWITTEEYNRLLNIVNTSSEPCVYIYGTSFYGDNFQGYLLEFYTGNYDPCLID